MDTAEISGLIGQPEDERLEYKAVLPPARTLGQLIAGLANSSGGYIVLGVVKTGGKVVVNGLSEDFRADDVTQRALSLLSHRPSVHSQYLAHSKKRLFVVSVEKSNIPVAIEGKVFRRQGDRTLFVNPTVREISPGSYARLVDLMDLVSRLRSNCTGSKVKVLDHYHSVLNIINDLKAILYPGSPGKPTESGEGKMLMRILFSSCADNFEIYLSELLYEIYLAVPLSLISNAQITVKEVLECADMQEFISYYAKKKLAKLQRGSVKGFIADNKQIASLRVLTAEHELGLERILQIRHLYSHRNGIVDERFLQHFPDQFKVNEEHRMSLDDFLEKFSYLVGVIDLIDKAAMSEYRLASSD
jgi:hypothetical protein